MHRKGVRDMAKDIHIAYNQVDAGYCTETGAKLHMLEQVYGYENFNGIGVVRAVPVSGDAELVFLELNSTNDNVQEITDKDHKQDLENIWFEAQVGTFFNNFMANGGFDGLRKKQKE